MNTVILKGNLTRDVELRYTADGTQIASTGIAVSKKYKSKTGEVKETVMFVDIVVWGRRGEVLSQYFQKGTPILIRGELQLDQWTAQDGTKRSKHSVKVEEFDFIQRKGDGDGARTYGGQQTYSTPPQTASSPAPARPEVPEIDVDEDEIPF